MWLPFRVPYRWIPRCWWKNISFIAYDLWRGPINIFRWAKLIWFDRDFDWVLMARLMEVKLTRMADVFENGRHTNYKLDARRCRMCAQLLKRLRDDNYFEKAQSIFGQSKYAAEHAKYMQAQDQRYLGMVIGKYLTHWWD
jgi:hypothetical protein